MLPSCFIALFVCDTIERNSAEQSESSRLIFIKHIEARSIRRVCATGMSRLNFLAKYEPLYINAHTAPTHWDFKGFETPVLN